MSGTNLIKSRMKSIRHTVQISKAQKLIASFKIGKARQMMTASSPYHDKVREAIAEVLAAKPDIISRYFGQNTDKDKKGYLVFTSDKGLAGGYNHNVIKMAEDAMKDKPPAIVLVLGYEGRAELTKAGYPVDKDFNFSCYDPMMYVARDIAEKLIFLLENHVVDSFDIIYTKYRSSVNMRPVIEKLFPKAPESFGVSTRRDFEFAPSAEEVMKMLFPKYLKGFIYGCMVEAWTCELTSRITAMESAVKNGEDILRGLELKYNRARQAAITQEITEIIAGTYSIIED